MELENPWRRLPDTAPYVLPEDADAVERFNAMPTRKPEHRFELGLWPEPYFGSPSAPIVLLALNPGVGPRDAVTHAKPWYGERARRSLLHDLGDDPFLHLQSDWVKPGAHSTPGAEWWYSKARWPIDAVGVERVSRGLFCVQLFPYHSRRFGSGRLSVPSQAYSFALVRAAMARGAEVISMRSWTLWCKAVPELASYERVHRLNSPQNVSLSPPNMQDGVFDRLCGVLS